jgi:hypothetical protein
MLVRTKEEDDEMKGGLGGLQGSGWASFLLLPFFIWLLLSLFLQQYFGGKTREVLKRALKQIKFGKIEFI